MYQLGHVDVGLGSVIGHTYTVRFTNAAAQQRVPVRPAAPDRRGLVVSAAAKAVCIASFVIASDVNCTMRSGALASSVAIAVKSCR